MFLKNSIFYFFLALIIFPNATHSQVVSSVATVTKDAPSTQKVAIEFPYDLKKPDETFEMEDELKEISGLSMCKKSGSIYSVQDENGILYEISKKSGKIKEKIKFYKDGDFEGVEVVGESAYVVKSNGTIFHIENFNTNKQKTIKHASFLEKGNDIEGLAYDKAYDRLLLPCKGFAHFDDKKNKLQKPVYEFDLKTKQVGTTPVFNLELKAMQSFIKSTKSEEDIEDDFKAFFKDEIKELPFSPSAIAIHPISGHIYILSSVGKLLLVTDGRGGIQQIIKIKKKVHRQPEGIAFEEDGTLYISNEGKDGKGCIYRFDYKTK